MLTKILYKNLTRNKKRSRNKVRFCAHQLVPYCEFRLYLTYLLCYLVFVLCITTVFLVLKNNSLKSVIYSLNIAAVQGFKSLNFPLLRPLYDFLG